MLDRMTYTNHLNEQIVIGKTPYFANYSDLHDYEWEYTEANSKILSFNKGIREYNLPVIIMCKTEEEGFQKRNAMYEIMEKDVLAKEYGTLEIGQYKLQCYVKTSAKADFLISKKHMVVNLSIVTDRPYWVKEKAYSFQTVEAAGGDTLTWDGNTDGLVDFEGVFYHVSDAYPTLLEAQNGGLGTLSIGATGSLTATDMSEDVGFECYQLDLNGETPVALCLSQNLEEDGVQVLSKGTYLLSDGGMYVSSLTINGYTGFGQGGGSAFLDYDIEYAYDYTNSMERLELVNQNFVASNFRLTIYGEALNPRISVNGHVYEVEGTVEAGQLLVIDSINKTITLYTKNGAAVNKFNSRNRDSYIFEKIPAGDLKLSRSDNFRFDLTLIEERGEPKWT